MMTSPNDHGSPSLIPECEVFLDGKANTDSNYAKCEKSSGHKHFIPVKEFYGDRVPEQLRDPDTIKVIRGSIERTVLIRVQHTSLNRPATFHNSSDPYPCYKNRGSSRIVRTGTGTIVRYVNPEYGKCPCLECTKSAHKRDRWYLRCYVVTVTHVVFDDSEAEQTVIKCFYDSEEDKDQIVTLYGVKIESFQSSEEMWKSDLCDGLMCVTHDDDSMKRVQSRISQGPLKYQVGWKKSLAVMISHPHGLSKMISIGKLFHISIQPDYVTTSKGELFVGKDISYSVYDSNEKHCIHSQLPVHPDMFMMVTLPEDAEYTLRYQYDNEGFTFPKGAKMTRGDGSVSEIPGNAVFQGMLLERYVNKGPRRKAYDIPTCPGCSGANVPGPLKKDKFGVYPIIPHMGWDAKGQLSYSYLANSEIDMCTFKESLDNLNEVLRKVVP